VIRRNALKTLVSLTALGFLMLCHPHKSFAGSSEDSDSDDRDSDSDDRSEASSSQSGGVNHELSNGNDFKNDSANSSNRSYSSGLSGEGNFSSSFGSNGYIKGSMANNLESQNELIEELNQLLESDGLETVTAENLKSVLEAFH
jgi:hypothetical protein